MNRLLTALAIAMLALSAIAATKAPDLATAEVVDLTYAFDEHTLYWPNSPISFEMKKQAYGMTANLEKLPEKGAWIIALPMKIGGGSGGPLRVVALLGK